MKINQKRGTASLNLKYTIAYADINEVITVRVAIPKAIIKLLRNNFVAVISWEKPPFWFKTSS